MSIGRIIRAEREKRGWTLQQAADRLGVSPQAVSQWEKDKDRPKVDNIRAISELYGLSLEALTTSQKRRGLIINSFDPDDSPPDDDHEDASLVSGVGERLGLQPNEIAEWDLRAGASYGGGYALSREARTKSGHAVSFEQVRAQWRLPENWLRGEMRLSYATTDILPVDGPSMSPDLEPGDRVLIDRSNRDPKQDAIFAIRDGESIIIKHVQLVRGSDPPRVVCRSSNPKYEPFELVLDGQQADIIGRVAGRISKL